jgi:hypothetical protein
MSTEITVVNDIIEINVTEEPIIIEAPSGAYPLPTGVYSVYGRTGNVVAQEGDYTLTLLGDVSIVTPSTGQVLRYNGTAWVNSTESYVGTVTSVAATVPTGLTITGSPITTSGTLAFGLAAGYSIPTTASQTTWDTAYNRSLTSAAVTGTTTKTLTLNQQSGGTITTSWTDTDTGLTSVGLSMPSAFSVANSPLTANGTLSVTGAGIASQYIRGDGTLANFPTSGGGGSSVAYYFNSSVSQGTLGGVAYRELNKVPIIGTGTDITISSNGYIANYITDPNDPSLLSIPAGNWNFEMYFSANSGGGTPSFYLELYKYDGTTFTLIASSSSTPEGITNGTAIDLYTTALAVPATSLTLTDRLAIRVYVNNSGRTITLHTEDNHLCEVITTFSTGLTALNGLTAQVQYFATGTSGTDFNISSATSTHTFNFPNASATNRGLLTSADWTTFNNKQNALTNPVTGTGTTNTLPKFTGTSAIGDSNITDTGSLITLGSDSIISNGSLEVSKNDRANGALLRLTNSFNGSGWIAGDIIGSLEFYSSDPSSPSTKGAIKSISESGGTYSTATGLSFETYTTPTLSQKMYLSSNGGLGIGTTSLTGYNLRIETNITGATSAYGVSSEGVVQSGVTANVNYYRTVASTVDSAFTITNLYHYLANQGTIGASSTVTNQVGFFASSNLINGTNIYGFRGLIPSGTNRWNLYMDGTANNHMAGSLSIGTTTSTGFRLIVGGTITGSITSYGIYSFGTIQSDVTSAAYMYRALPSTAAASFTLSNLYNYHSSAGTVGAGATITNHYGYYADALSSGTNNYGFFGAVAAGTGRWNLFMTGTADNFLSGNTGIGVSSGFVSSGPILTSTLTNGGSGYVDGTYTDVASSIISGSTFADYALFTIVVSGGIVTTATLTWGGTSYKVGDTVTVSNTLLGGTGSGLVITINTVDSSQLSIASANGGDITLMRNDSSLAAGENIGTIKWGGRDSSFKSSGLYAEIGAFAAGTLGGAYLSFFTRSVSAGTSLVEAMRIDSRGGVGIGATVLTQYGLKVAKNITGSTISYNQLNEGIIQSDVTNQGHYYSTNAQTQAATFTLGTIFHYRAIQGTFGVGSTITSQAGFWVDNSLIGATNNYGFYGNIASGTNRWNLYMNGTAANYMAGSLAIGTTSITSKLSVITPAGGNTSGFSVGSTNGLLNIWGGSVSGVVFDVTNGTLNGSTGTDFLFRQGGLTSMLINSSQQVGIGSGLSSVNASAQLQVDSTIKGFLPPRMTTVQKLAIATPAAGLMVYDTTLNQMSYYNGTLWINF